MRTIKVLLIGLVALVFLLAACSPKPTAPAEPVEPAEPAEKTYADLVIGFAQVGAESEWRTAETDSIRTTAEELGVDLTFTDAQQDQEKQIASVRSFIAKRVDVIGVPPIVGSGWEPVLQEAKDAGIPVIFVDRKAEVPDDLYTSFIGSDFALEGYNACLEMAKLLPDGGKVIELQGTVGADPATLRMEGFLDCIAKEDTGLEILDTQTGDFTRALGKEVMEAFLQQYGDEINGVYAHNDDMAIGAIQAIEEAGYTPGEDVIIISIDGVRGAFEAMAEGKLNCTLECNPLLGPQFFEAALTLANGGTVEKWIKSDEGIFCGTDVANSELPNRKY